MEENKFWLRIWSLIAGCISILVLTLGSCTAYTNKLIAQSADPIATSCATSNGNSAAYQCIVSNKGAKQ
jgi:hypothetical protein